MTKNSWIKLKTNTFDDARIRLIEALPQGDTILVVWFKLLTHAEKTNATNGNLTLSDEEMSVIFERPLSVIRLSLEIFERYEMITIHDGAIRIKN